MLEWNESAGHRARERTGEDSVRTFMRLVTALALACACLISSGVAEAAVVSHSAPAFGAASAVSNTIADFDPSLGTLERVQLRLSGTASDHVTGAVRGRHYSDEGDYGRPSSRSTFADVTGVPFVFLGLYGAELSGDPVTFPLMIVSGSFSGGYSTPLESGIDLPVEIFGKRVDLPVEFFGSDPGGGKTYALGAGTASVGLPFSTWFWESNPGFRGTATITYFYSPVGVSEPASPAVLGLGLIGCLAARTSRRRRVRLAAAPASNPRVCA